MIKSLIKNKKKVSCNLTQQQFMMFQIRNLCPSSVKIMLKTAPCSTQEKNNIYWELVFTALNN